MKLTIILASIAAWLAICTDSVSTATTPCFPCDPKWPKPIYYPDYQDCAYIWECSNGNLTRTSCDAGLVFEFLLQACVPDSDEMLFTCNKLLGKTKC